MLNNNSIKYFRSKTGILLSTLNFTTEINLYGIRFDLQSYIFNYACSRIINLVKFTSLKTKRLPGSVLKRKTPLQFIA